MTFQEVIGQEDAKERLRMLVQENRVPHAMLFCGPQGCGKMALAMAFASYLLCANKADGDSCGHCPQCAMTRKWSHPDLHFTYPVIKAAGTSSDYKPVSDDFAREWHRLLGESPYFTIDHWLREIGAGNQQAIITVRESDEISRKLSLKSSQGGYKVSLIWLPERMNEASANKLLKLIEEPPSQTVFLLVSEEPVLLLETIRSRTQRFDMRAIETQAIEQSLIDQRGIDAPQAHRIARVAAGSWTKALDLLSAENEEHEFLDMFMRMNRQSFERNIRGMRTWSDDAYDMGRERQRRMLRYFLRMIRESFMYNFRIPELNYMTEEEDNFVRRFAPYVNEANVIEMSDLMAEGIRDIGQNANARIVFFDTALRMTRLLRNK
ncbi:MAG: DNA polymerase III subunit delta [Prevotella sp.]|nr:DNA polymerase III subunit delta [Prevotella sp.]